MTIFCQKWPFLINVRQLGGGCSALKKLGIDLRIFGPPHNMYPVMPEKYLSEGYAFRKGVHFKIWCVTGVIFLGVLVKTFFVNHS